MDASMVPELYTHDEDSFMSDPRFPGPIGFLETALALAQRDGTLPVELLEQVKKVVAKTNSMNQRDIQARQVLGDIRSKCEFVCVDSLQYSQISVWFRVKSDKSLLYRPFRENLALPFISAICEKRGYLGWKDKAKAIYDTLKISSMRHEDVVPKDIIRVSNKYYWDTDNAMLTNNTEKPCFRELFDSSGQSSVSVDINDVKFEPYEINIITRYIEANKGIIPTATPSAQDLAPVREDFDSDDDFEILAPLAASTLPNKVTQALAPFATWATVGDNVSIDTMNDILKVFCVPFLNTPPKWYVYYIGDTRNGKSSCIKCQRVLMGLNNTSGFAMPDIFDPHNTNHILTTMLNAADEDFDFPEKEMQRGLANFKKAVTHDEIDLPNFYSQDSTTLTPKFMSIFSRNSLPNFGEGDGAQAIVKRMRAIFFRNDLSKFDNNGHDFEKETYNARYYSMLLPVILGYARYYNNKLLDLSDTCKSNSDSVEAIADPATHFFNELCYWFDYAGKSEFIIDQAKIFFKERGIKYSGETLTAINNKLGQCEVGRLRSFLGIKKERERCRLLPNKKKRNRIKILCPDAILAAWNNGTFEQWRQDLSKKSNSMTPQQFADMDIPSIFTILRDWEDDGLNPVAMQEALIKKEKMIEDADIDDKGNLVSSKGEIINGLL